MSLPYNKGYHVPVHMRPKKADQKILIMCGGRGRRLGKLGDQVPKPLVKLGEQTILEKKIEQFIAEGHHQFIFCIGYKGDMIRDAVKKYDNSCDCVFSDSGEEAGILKRLYDAKDHFDHSVHMTYGDTLTQLDLNKLSDFHNDHSFEASIVTAPILNPFGLVEYDQNNQVTFFKEKPTLNYYIGQALINKSSMDLIPSKLIDLPDGEGLVTFFKVLSAMEKLGAYPYDGFQITFNTQKELSDAEEQIKYFYTSPENHEE